MATATAPESTAVIMEAPASPSRKMLWTGRIISAIPAALLLFGGIMKVTQSAAVLEGFEQLGYSRSAALPIGIVEIACAVLYIVPRTAVLGAILVTGYLGGATATHVRVGDQFIIPVLFGLVVWLGLYLRDSRLRDLLPLRKSAVPY